MNRRGFLGKIFGLFFAPAAYKLLPPAETLPTGQEQFDPGIDLWETYLPRHQLVIGGDSIDSIDSFDVIVADTLRDLGKVKFTDISASLQNHVAMRNILRNKS
jgi:hypothetical protein